MNHTACIQLWAWFSTVLRKSETAYREERDQIEREAKNKEWAAQEAERAGEWYYKEVCQCQYFNANSTVASSIPDDCEAPKCTNIRQKVHVKQIGRLGCRSGLPIHRQNS